MMILLSRCVCNRYAHDTRRKWIYSTHRLAILQKYYIRIVFLVPNYALCSFFSLVFRDAALYIETVRDMYGILVHIELVHHPSSVYFSVAASFM